MSGCNLSISTSCECNRKVKLACKLSFLTSYLRNVKMIPFLRPRYKRHSLAVLVQERFDSDIVYT